MSGGLPSLLRIAAGVVLGLSGLMMVRRLAWAPASVLACLTSTAWPLARAWGGARGTALRAVVPWAVLAVVLGMVGLIFALATHRSVAPRSGEIDEYLYLSALASLASTI